MDENSRTARWDRGRWRLPCLLTASFLLHIFIGIGLGGLGFWSLQAGAGHGDLSGGISLTLRGEHSAAAAAMRPVSPPTRSDNRLSRSLTRTDSAPPRALHTPPQIASPTILVTQRSPPRPTSPVAILSSAAVSASRRYARAANLTPSRSAVFQPTTEASVQLIEQGNESSAELKGVPGAAPERQAIASGHAALSRGSESSGDDSGSAGSSPSSGPAVGVTSVAGVRGLPFGDAGGGNGGGSAGSGTGEAVGAGPGIGDGGKRPVRAVYVLDCSGSMKENNKISYARQALTQALWQLRPNDSFNIITFNGTAKLMWREFQPAEPRAFEEAVHRIAKIELPVIDLGTTNYSAAFDTAFDPDALPGETVIFFITDGIPDEGVGVSENQGFYDAPALRAYVRDHNQQHAAIFTYAISDQDTWTQDFLTSTGAVPGWKREVLRRYQMGIDLLRDIAADSGGSYRFVNVLAGK